MIRNDVLTEEMVEMMTGQKQEEKKEEGKKQFEYWTDILELINSGVSIGKIIEAIRADPKCICDLPYQPEWACAAAASVDPDALCYIRNPSREVAMTAIKSFKGAIKYIVDPDAGLKIAAIEHDPHSIKYINNLNEIDVIRAVNICPSVLKYVGGTHPEAATAAICKDPSALRFIDGAQDTQLCVLAYSVDKSSLKYIHTYNEGLENILLAMAETDEDKEEISDHFYALHNVSKMLKEQIDSNGNTEWRCECGQLHGLIRIGETCVSCNTQVTQREVNKDGQ